MTPSYSLLLNVINPNISPGESIVIEIFVSGYGNIKKSKLLVTYPGTLVKKDNPGHILQCIGGNFDEEGNVIGYITGKKYLERVGDEAKWPLSERGALVILNPANFINHPKYDDAPLWGLQPILAEWRHDDLPPMIFKLNTSSKTPSGDIEINFIFTYSDGENIFSDRVTKIIHIKSWADRHSKKLAIIGIFLALFSLPLISTFIDWVKPIIINVINKLPN